MKKNNLKEVVFLTLLISISIILGLFEVLIKAPISFPGVRIGLSNIVIMYLIYNNKYAKCILVLFLKVVILSLIKGSLFSFGFILSITGASISFIFSIFLHYFFKFHIISISIFSSITHSFIQLLFVILILNTKSLIYYMPFILTISFFTGIITGYISNIICKSIKYPV